MENGTVGTSNANAIEFGANVPKKSKKGLIAGLCAVLVLLIGGVVAMFVLNPKKTPDTPSQPSKPNEPITYTDGGSFALNFFKEAYKADSKNENMLVSPYSMDAVWRLALEGADGETSQEILETIGARSVSSYPQLKVANGLFVRDTFEKYMQPDFLTTFEGDLRYDSFATADAINNWVSENTDGMIKGILDEAPSSDMVAMLLNAVAMDEKWATQFEAGYTSGEDFTQTSGDILTTAMMDGKAEAYFETDNAEGIVKEYKEYEDGSAFEFVGILPNGSVNEYIANLDQEELKATTDNLILNDGTEDDGSVNRVSVSLPKFKYDYDLVDGIKTMNKLGIEKAFDKDGADFSKMIYDESGEYSFFVSSVLQRAHIEMSEEGTKAAAVSGLGMNATSALDTTTYNYYHVDFDRPFVYLIRDKSSKEIIFAGVVETPSEWDPSEYMTEE